MGNGQYKHGNQRHKSHPNIASINRKASTSTTSSLHEKYATNTPRDGMSRTASGSDINEKNYSLFFPLEKLSKILHQKTQHECGVNGIAQEIFVKYVFPKYPDLGERIFRKMHKLAKAKTKHLGVTAFRQQCEMYLSVLDDALIHEHYVKMFFANGSLNAATASKENAGGQQQPLSDEELLLVNTNGLTDLLLICFRIGVANYIASAGKADVTTISADTICPHIKRTITSVTQSCFFTKDTLSVGFVCRWLEKNLPNLIMPLHRFCVHTLTTVYRTIEEAEKVATTSQSSVTGATNEVNPLLLALNKELRKLNEAACERGTPEIITGNTLPSTGGLGKLMPLSQSWLLAAALPNVFTRVQERKAPITPQPSGKLDNPDATIPAIDAAAASPIPHLMSTIPTHWSLLYDSQQHGVGSNRFLHHVIGYKGPTLVLLHSETDEIFCLASPSEWRETHLYTGTDDCHIIQLLPKFSILEKGPKLLYLNTCIRGYPKGLRAGPDPRKPLLSVDEHFEKIEYRSVPSVLFAIEVYGCGDRQIRDIQLDIKKWQVTEAERQRTVKLTSADWIDHPDRYLLELGGRPQYNNA
ncbi:uncharacterized protein LOC129574895 [Sitodiplosis mosellana]|uniref:uncharacterized protein LOC129574895 n=1 Tax=Sitodiplosis mosellana TaxID=263140 RepID=UPI002443936B|nr:uncharacterized protein LOC129574895 [Sitodiplosis mosellana]XP_055313495.1 uncharacterized protein LOC129574895 [Sitodiplosis mosellana]XP_055313496.1 uncharacterized protein LOC129574895 [Sitodiplosis mosellana]